MFKRCLFIVISFVLLMSSFVFANSSESELDFLIAYCNTEDLSYVILETKHILYGDCYYMAYISDSGATGDLYYDDVASDFVFIGNDYVFSIIINAFDLDGNKISDSYNSISRFEGSLNVHVPDSNYSDFIVVRALQDIHYYGTNTVFFSVTPPLLEVVAMEMEGVPQALVGQMKKILPVGFGVLSVMLLVMLLTGCFRRWLYRSTL